MTIDMWPLERYSFSPLEFHRSTTSDFLPETTTTMRSAGRIVSRDQIAAILYQRESTPYERSVDVHVSHLRKKLEHGNDSMIRTVRGVGYLFSADA